MKKKPFSRLIPIFLCLILCLFLLPVTAMANTPAISLPEESGGTLQYTGSLGSYPIYMVNIPEDQATLSVNLNFSPDESAGAGPWDMCGGPMDYSVIESGALGTKISMDLGSARYSSFHSLDLSESDISYYIKDQNSDFNWDTSLKYYFIRIWDNDGGYAGYVFIYREGYEGIANEQYQFHVTSANATWADTNADYDDGIGDGTAIDIDAVYSFCISNYYTEVAGSTPLDKIVINGGEFAIPEPSDDDEPVVLDVPGIFLTGSVAAGTVVSFDLYAGTDTTAAPLASATGTFAKNSAGSDPVAAGTYKFCFTVDSLPDVSQLTVVARLDDADPVTKSYDVAVATPTDDDYVNVAICAPGILSATMVHILKGANSVDAMEAALEKEYPAGCAAGTWYIDSYGGFINDIGVDPTGAKSGYIDTYHDYVGWGTYTVNTFFADVGAYGWICSDGEVVLWGISSHNSVTTRFVGGGISNVWAFAALRDHYTDDELLAAGLNNQTTTDELMEKYPAYASEMTWHIADSIKAVLDPVKAEIDAIGTVTADSGAAIEAARTAYNGISRAYRQYLFRTYNPYKASYELLVAAEKAYAALTGAEAIDPIDALVGSQNYIQTQITNPTPGSVGGEWAALSLARGGAIDPEGDWADTYLSNLDAALSAGGTVVSKTDYERVTLALSALGIDASAYGTIPTDLTAPFATYDADMLLNAKIFALLALDAKPYTATSAASSYVSDIVAAALPDGGWTFFGDTADVDLTSMALQALAPYRSGSSAVNAAIIDAYDVLLDLQDETTGGFLGYDGTLSTCSTAQVVTAICTLGAISPDSAPWVTATGGSPLTALLTYYNKNTGAFGETSTAANEMATEQAAYALVAYERMAYNQNDLYDMSDAFEQSSNVLVRSVSVDGVKADKRSPGWQATPEYYVTLPYGTELPADASAFTIRTADVRTQATVSQMSATRWSLHLTAEDGTTDSYAINITISEDNAANNMNALLAARQTVENTAFTIPMARANTEQLVKAWLDTRLAQLNLNGATAETELDNLTAATAGTAANQSGTPGSFAFTVTLSKGSGGTLATLQAGLSGVITATAYSGGSGSETGGDITETFRLIGSTLSSGDIDLGNGDYKGAKYVTWIKTESYKLDSGSTVYDLFTKALADAGLRSVGASGNYVKTIYAPAVCGGYQLSEFTNGRYSGWMYTVDGSHPGAGLQDYKLSDGDTVVWHYVNDYRYEVTDWFDDPNYPSLGDGTYYNEWLKAPDVAPTANSNTSSGGTPAASSDSSTFAPKVTVVSGTAAVAVGASDLSGTIAKAKENGSKAIVIAPEITGTATKVSVDIPTSSLSSVASQTSADLTVQTPVGNVTIPNSALDSIVSQASGGSVTVSLNTVDSSSLTDAQKSAVGDNPVYDISMMSGNNHIANFGGSAITISLPYTLKVGEDPSNVTVWYLDDSGKLQQMACTYDKTTGMATFTATHLSYYVVGYSEAWKNPFADVRSTDWFYEAVAFAVQNGLFNGMSTTTFSPNDPMTRAMLVTVLYRLDGSLDVTGTNSFTDVADGQWYTNAVTWANANSIVSGYGGGLFGTNDNVTREQMAAILYNYAKYKGCDVTKTADLTAFTDASNISNWARTSMKWANAEGLITGVTTTTLAPVGNATRAQVATILQRFVESLVE